MVTILLLLWARSHSLTMKFILLLMHLSLDFINREVLFQGLECRMVGKKSRFVNTKSCIVMPQ